MTKAQQQRLAQILDRLEILICRVEVVVRGIVADRQSPGRPKAN